MAEPDPSQPPMRQGPRPLAVHLTAASGYYASSIAASLALKSGSIAWNPELRAEAAALEAALGQQRRPPQNARRESGGPEKGGPGNGAPDPHAAFALAVDREVRGRIGLMLRGIEAYRNHPYRRDLPPPEMLWREETTVLHDYRPFLKGRGTRMPVVLIPSLVNRAYILDLKAEQSLARWLSAAGHPVFLVDWQAPGPVERRFALNDYIARLRRAITAASEATGTPVAAVGYCMGGLLALAAALGVEERVDALVLMATPWDFQTGRPEQAAALAALLPGLEATLARTGELPVDILQTLFAALDPMQAVRKFAAFARRPADSPAAEAFVAMEDWLNDGVPLAAPVARETIGGWYGANAPARGQWRIDGLPVDPARWTKPALSLIPADDRIVPPASARALADALPHGVALSPAAGHIGMVTARNAPDRVWGPLARFLADP